MNVMNYLRGSAAAGAITGPQRRRRVACGVAGTLVLARAD